MKRTCSTAPIGPGRVAGPLFFCLARGGLPRSTVNLRPPARPRPRPRPRPRRCTPWIKLGCLGRSTAHPVAYVCTSAGLCESWWQRPSFNPAAHNHPHLLGSSRPISIPSRPSLFCPSLPCPPCSEHCPRLDLHVPFSPPRPSIYLVRVDLPAVFALPLTWSLRSFCLLRPPSCMWSPALLAVSLSSLRA